MIKEPKAMRGLHRIKEEMSKLSYKELEKALILIRKKYRKIMVS